MNVGIDFSLNSTAICIEAENDYKFLNFINSKKNQYLLDLEKLGIDILIYDKQSGSKEEKYFIKERKKLNNYINLNKTILDQLKQYKIKNIIIEGFSFNSKSQRLAEIAGAQYILRIKLIEEQILESIENLYFVAPQTVKKTSKGNIKRVKKGQMQKEEMIENFISNILEDNKLSNNQFYQSLKSNTSNFQTKLGVFKKPVDDLIDSYFILKSLQNI